MRNPGATSYDKAAHTVIAFAAHKGEPGEYRITEETCAVCGKALEVTYCEERLYAVRCRRCNTVTLVKSENPEKAARQIGGRRAYWRPVTPGSDVVFECSNCGRLISSSWGCCGDEDTDGNNGCDPTEEWLYCPTCGHEMNEEPPENIYGEPDGKDN